VAAHDVAPAPSACRHTVVLGLAFGDEGKGTIVDALVRQGGATCVVRWNGGPQAAHNVVLSDGRAHCFAQHGAGTLAGARTHLGPRMLVDPLGLEEEGQALAKLGVTAPLGRVTVDRRCVLVTPMHRSVNRIQELVRGAGRHGSCGKGVGQAYLDSLNPNVPTLRAGDVEDEPGLRRTLRFLQLVKVDLAEQLTAAAPELAPHVERLKRTDLVDDLVAAYREILGAVTLDDGTALARTLDEERCVLEGAQGVLLDAEQGFFPHVTPSRTTGLWADELAPGARKLGVLRAYGVRHGPGPFPSEEPTLALPETHNLPNAWQGPMRVGWLDLAAARLALKMVPVDALALTCLDRLAGLPQVKVCTRWEGLEPAPPSTRAEQEHLTQMVAGAVPVFETVTEGELIPRIEGSLGVSVAVTSSGSTEKDKVFRTS
jgi:adenylosuccinate synthase